MVLSSAPRWRHLAQRRRPRRSKSRQAARRNRSIVGPAAPSSWCRYRTAAMCRFSRCVRAMAPCVIWHRRFTLLTSALPSCSRPSRAVQHAHVQHASDSLIAVLHALHSDWTPPREACTPDGSGPSTNRCRHPAPCAASPARACYAVRLVWCHQSAAPRAATLWPRHGQLRQPWP